MFQPAASLTAAAGLTAAAWAGQSALRQALRPRIWLPFFLIALAQTVVLLILAGAFHPRLVPLTLPFVRWVGGDAATHYPVYFHFLPALFARADYLISVLVASLAMGAGTLYFAQAYGRRPPGGVWPLVFRRLPALVAVSAVAVGGILLVYQLLSLVPQAMLLENASLRWGIRALEFALVVLVQALLAYTTAWILLKGKTVLGALKHSLILAARLFLPTLLIVGIPFALLFPIRYLAGRADLFIDKFRPESLVWVLQADILMGLVLGFLVVGSATWLFLWRTGENP